VRIQWGRSEQALLDDDILIVADNLPVLGGLPRGSFDLVYMDPPFNTGVAQTRERLAVTRDDSATRVGFGGRRYRSTVLQSLSYDDRFGDYLGFLEPRIRAARELLADHGTLYFHIDYREAHYCKLLLDEIFGRDAFLNELIWSYDYGAKPRRRWPAKHDTILVYVRSPGAHHFDADAVDREPYMAPGLVSAEKAARGKRPTDVWFHTIVPTNGAEKTGYPTQKPEGVLRRIVSASSRPGGWCLDPFAGSGTLGAVCRQLGRRFVLIDSNPTAAEIIRRRLLTESRARGVA
jgi:site-specific DNA-methyltransferase (adenine-specific)